jgi:gluconolactonase
MIATPENVTLLGSELDHPEGVYVAPDGTVYAGGEAGQVYRIAPDGTQSQIGSTGGFLLGLALDGDGALHACDTTRAAVMRIASDGVVTERSSGTAERRMILPNYPVFDTVGSLYVSDSGEYWHDSGTGAVFIIHPDDTTEVFHAGPFRFANGLAIDPTQTWLYVAQSTAWNVVRVPLDQPNGPIEVTHVLPPHSVADGLAFAEDGRLIITCYRPDIIYLGYPDGRVEVLLEDLTAELLNRPTNAALHDGMLYLANLGGWHLSVLETDMWPAPIHRPFLQTPQR